MNALILHSFDQARLIRQNRILAENGIDPSGMLFGFSTLAITDYVYTSGYRHAVGLEGGDPSLNTALRTMIPDDDTLFLFCF